MAHSLRQTNKRYPLIAMVSDQLSPQSIGRLKQADITLRPLSKRFQIPSKTLQGISVDRWQASFDKLEAFDMFEYDKVVYVDGDMLINRNIEDLFDAPHMSAAVYYGRVKPFAHFSFPNAGLLVVQPQVGLADKIFACWPQVSAAHATFSDQDLIHQYYRNLFNQRRGAWELPVTYNSCAFVLDKILIKHGLNVRFKAPDSRTVAVVHFSSPNKPWRMSVGFVAYLFSRKLLIGKWREVYAYIRYFSVLNTIRRATTSV